MKYNTQKQVFETARWKEIEVGQIIKVEENEYFPCDMMVLTSNLPKGICYVETKNLDGETNLKHKQANKDVHAMCESEDDILRNFKTATIECEKQNDSIYTFAGFMKF